MSDGRSCCNCSGRACVVLGLVLAFALGCLVVRRMIKTHPGEGPRTARAQERSKNMREFREALTKDNTGYGVVNKEAGIYRIPIERAMEISAREWKNPAAGHELLTNRVAKAVPPPPPPAPKSPFE